jgi:hypothetical protein
MAKIGRNDACPCGSGKKYKRCCQASPTTAQIPSKSPTENVRPSMPRFVHVEDELDVVSNSVVDLIDDNRFDEALLVCDRLRTEYPGVIDWLVRSAMVHQARGEDALAADFYRRAITFSEQPDQRDGFDEELREDYRRSAITLEARVTAARQT